MNLNPNQDQTQSQTHRINPKHLNRVQPSAGNKSGLTKYGPKHDNAPHQVYYEAVQIARANKEFNLRIIEKNKSFDVDAKKKCEFGKRTSKTNTKQF